MDVHPTKNVSIGIDPYPYRLTTFFCDLKTFRKEIRRTSSGFAMP